jgi:hypothetical protein
MYPCLAVFFVLGIQPAQGRADDPGPPAPDGWQYVIPKDQSYRFLFPTLTRSIGYTSRKFTARGFRAEVLINYCTLRDDTTYFEVQGATFTGRGVGGLKADDLYDLMIEGEKQLGFTVGESKDFLLGKTKAREYRMKKGDRHFRSVLVAEKNRVFELKITSRDETKLESDQANTFFQSFVVLKGGLESASKEPSAKAAEKARATMEKLGFKWTLNVAEMTAPDKPVTGLIHDREFKPDSITREAISNLRFRQGPASAPEIEVRIIMFFSPSDKLENRTIEVHPGRKSAKDPTVLLSSTDPATRRPKSSSFDQYAMKLTFGPRGADGLVPCTIYLCSSDETKSLLAGKFSLPAK